jgi:hypothetical protein
VTSSRLDLPPTALARKCFRGCIASETVSLPRMHCFRECFASENLSPLTSLAISAWCAHSKWYTLTGTSVWKAEWTFRWCLEAREYIFALPYVCFMRTAFASEILHLLLLPPGALLPTLVSATRH